MHSLLDLKLQHALKAMLLMALVMAVFWPALHGGFIFDDYPIFAENPAIHITGWHAQEWARVWTWAHVNIQRPLAMLSFAFNYALGNDSFGFKFTNLCIHLLNTWLVLLLTKRLLQAAWSPHGPDKTEDRHRGYWALGIAAAWAIHPLQVSTVMYVVQRMEMLGFTFTLLALLAYWHMRQNQLKGIRSWPWVAMYAAFVLLGYFAKETAVLIPGYSLLLELTVLRFAAARPTVTRTWKWLYAAGCIGAVLAFVFYLLPHYAQLDNFAGRNFTPWQRELTQLRALPMYIYWIVLPLPNHLAFYYDNYPVSTSLLHPITTLTGGIFLTALLVLAVAMRQRRPLLALGIAWFFLAHALTSSPISLELVFEHRNYPALFGILLAVADVLWLLAQRISPRTVALITIVLLANFSLLTYVRASTWGDRLLLTQALTSDNPGSPRAAYDLARRYMYMAQNDPQSPFYSLSIKELRRARSLPDASPIAEETLLVVQAEHHDQNDVPALWEGFQNKLRDRPLGPEAFLALDKLTTARLQGQTGIDANQLARAYEIIIPRIPTRANLHSSYAELAGAVLHEPKLAIVHWQQALRLDKDAAGYGRRLAGYLIDARRYDEALAVIDEACRLQPALRSDAEISSLQRQAQQGIAGIQAPSTQPSR